jgi:hypothetical protein
MSQQQITFRITELVASVPEGVPIEWQGREFSSGPLVIELENNAEGRGNTGVLDYSQSHAEAEFHLRVQFPELTGILVDLGVDPMMTEPVHAVLRSEGKILNDHSFALSGQTELGPHAIFTPEDTAARVLPGH